MILLTKIFLSTLWIVCILLNCFNDKITKETLKINNFIFCVFIILDIWIK